MSSLKAKSKIDSPKTPGGISKSLLTPCRRVGLSRNWRKSGPSPFVSPLAGNAEVKIEKREDPPATRTTRKRKEPCDEEESKTECLPSPLSHDISPDADDSDIIADKSKDLDSTPLRNVSNPRRKKSKTLLPSKVDHTDANTPKTTDRIADLVSVEITQELNKENETNKDGFNTSTNVATPVRTKSKSKVKISTNVIQSPNASDTKDNSKKIETDTKQECNDINKDNPKQKSPNNLTKECIVVLQKKIYKKDLNKLKQNEAKEEWVVKKSVINPVSQILFDSDSDDVPLSTLNNKVEKTKLGTILNKQDEKTKLETINEDDDFAENTKVKVKILEDKTTSTGGLRNDTSKKKHKTKKDGLSIKSKPKTIETKVLHSKPSSQSSVDDDEDFVMDNKRTILIKKSYEKVTKPLKAKSTGSITQKDIDELKARIEIKKKLLLAKAVTKDTEELRDLVKKWQKGCQDALMELMELMRNKFPDKQNMDYSEILQTLKIPASLVGYDEENDCFGTPTDENIILSKFNDT